MKKTLSILMAMMVIFVSTNLKINAQGEVSDAWSEIAGKSSNELTSMEIIGDIALAIESQGRQSEVGFVEGEFILNDDPIGAQLLLNVISPMIGEPISFEMYATDGVTYLYNSQEGKWEVEQWTSTAAEIRKELEEAMKSSQNELSQENLSAESSNFIEKYFTVKDEEDRYAFTLNEKIDGKEFYEDLDKAVDLDTVINNAVEEADQQADQIGKKVDSNYEESLRNVINPDAFADFFKMEPQFTIVYDKVTGLFQSLDLGLKINSDLISERISTREAAYLPEWFHLNSKFEAKGYGEKYDIQVPTEATNSQNPVPDEETTEEPAA
ncbi:hypothetical protein HZY91_09430 [Facklamia sp. DSM 111018]|uniref:Uncharacterized protein n=1 Tax=Facklamia lactis TaxID=2749967 RepID=A0ABS0LSE9_9LACT|nr:hypothetical protein [Facklamia lactis]MBG9981436.1 hypothetical protein [Facklamia lactis]MBG9987088.1 hypothetical protein [Facklamia lactis]